MRIPTEHFGNVPVILLSPSLLNSPSTSGTSSPCHLATAASGHQNNNYHSHSNYINEMDAFPRTLMERLMRPENDMKVRRRPLSRSTREAMPLITPLLSPAETVGSWKCSCLSASPPYLDDKHARHRDLWANGQHVVVPGAGATCHAVKLCQRSCRGLDHVEEHGRAAQSAPAESRQAAFSDQHAGETQPVRVHVVGAEGEPARRVDGGLQWLPRPRVGDHSIFETADAIKCQESGDQEVDAGFRARLQALLMMLMMMVQGDDLPEDRERGREREILCQLLSPPLYY